MELKLILQRSIVRHHRESLLELPDKGKVPAGGVLSMREVFEKDEARDMMLERLVGDCTIRGVSSKASCVNERRSRHHLSPPPANGQHITAVLGELAGMTGESIVECIEKQVVFQCMRGMFSTR
jgi:crotonobetainyl-CoA:carnitine CoA-transferase CaiB-like acyl-CoA transferase